MQSLDRLIAEATALPDADKVILIDKISENIMASRERDVLYAEVLKDQERITEIDHGSVQTIPGDIALATARKLFETLNMSFIQQLYKNMQKPYSSSPSSKNTKNLSTRWKVPYFGLLKHQNVGRLLKVKFVAT